MKLVTTAGNSLLRKVTYREAGDRPLKHVEMDDEKNQDKTVTYREAGDRPLKRPLKEG